MFQPWRTACLCAIAIIALPSWCLDAALDENVNPSQVFFASRNVNAGNDATYLSDGLIQSKGLRRIAQKSTIPQNPDTTIVLLNWRRLQNVILQASVYCSPSLQGVVEQIFVWNNQPSTRLTYEEHFATTGCSPERLRIFNSPSNLYFRARFMGCVDSLSRYCFLQDDDYITYSDILLNIHASFRRSEQMLEIPAPIILLPSHDLLETELMRITIPGIRPGQLTIHTTFSWLGHGTFLLRSQAETYLDLLRRLNLTDEEMNMADNYFTLLSGQMPNVWCTHSIELDNKFPFTAGVSGNERNWRHIERAMEYLNKILESTELSPHLSMATRLQSLPKLTASCIANPCTVQSNIHVLPPRSTSNHAWSSEELLQGIQSRRIASLGEESARWYVDNPIFNAVDGHVETAFRSAGTARAGEYISLTLLAGEVIGSKNDTSSMDLASLVDANTATILHASEIETSRDGVNWSPLKTSKLTCFPTNTSLSADMRVKPPSILGLSVDHEMKQRDGFDRTTPSAGDLLECFTAFELTVEWDSHVHVKITLDRDFDFGWSIYEVWLRAS